MLSCYTICCVNIVVVVYLQLAMLSAIKKLCLMARLSSPSSRVVMDLG